jgi:hypothetical protein
MRLPIALATMLLATTTALPAFAASPAPIGASLRDAAVSPIETVQNRQTTRNRQATQNRQTRQRRQARSYRGYDAYAAAPRAPVYGYGAPWGGGFGTPWGAYGSASNAPWSYGYGSYGGYSNPWGHCVRLGEHTPGRGAFPDWDIC